ncbi:MAG: PilT/PilU family type 4a pilus ATPase, partial [Victivallales bacterium]
MISELLGKMAAQGASDLFVSAGKIPYVRVSTLIQPLNVPPVPATEIERFRMEILSPESETKYQQAGSVDTGFSLDGVRYRINFLLQQGQPGLVARLVPSGELDFAYLNLPRTLAEFAERPRGLVLIVGAAGSGKSTTMAAMLNHINAKFAKHIVTIEDPIEFVHSEKKSLITQREIGADSSSFAEALRNVVRESPDVIFIGEMRDLETMQIAISAALTGHLVISTVHTANVIQCIERIVNNFPEHLREQAAADLSLAVEGIVAQRLVPKADGDGMVPAVEILKGTPLVRRVIAGRHFSDLEDMIKRGSEDGMQTFSRALAELCKSGKITLEAGSTAATNREEFILLVQGMESGVDTFRADIDIEAQDEKVINMKRLLHSAVSNGASDLLITAGSCPCLRIDGELKPLATDPLSASDTKRLLFSLLNSKQREIFEERREIDFALSINIHRKDEGGQIQIMPYRFRLNGFYQRGSVATAIRVIPKGIPTPEELGLPKTLVNMM